MRKLAVLLLLAFAPFAVAQPTKPAKEKKPAANADRFVFAVSEGTSGGIDNAAAIEKYRPLADRFEMILGKRVVVFFVRDFSALEAGMKKGEFDLVMARPSDYPARGIRDYGYRLAATAKPDGQCFLIVDKNSALKSIADAKGKRFQFPEKVAYMTRFCQAEIRDRGINLAKESVNYAKEQGTVGWTLDNGFADVGAVASYSGVAKSWESKGGRILHRSAPKPYSPIIAGKRVSADALKRISQMLAELDQGDAGKKVLSSIGVEGFNIESSARLLDLLKWLEK
jgi:ABC-type phosphate/phosphonate transport system substrate-binding protein